jgi:hypothetical protein
VEEVEVGIVLVVDIQVVQEVVDQDQDKQEHQQLNHHNQVIQELMDLDIEVVIHLAEAELAEAEQEQ